MSAGRAQSLSLGVLNILLVGSPNPSSKNSGLSPIEMQRAKREFMEKQTFPNVHLTCDKHLDCNELTYSGSGCGCRHRRWGAMWYISGPSVPHNRSEVLSDRAAIRSGRRMGKSGKPA